MKSRVVACLLALSSLADGEKIPARQYTIADGLPTNRIERIVSDTRGFLWFCTREGVSRFDGRRFVNLGSADRLPEASVTSIAAAPDSSYWILSQSEGVTHYQPADLRKLFTPYEVGVQKGAGRFNAVYLDRSGSVWIGANWGVYRLARGAREFQPIEVAPGRLGASAFAEDRSGNLWIATFAGGLFRRSPDGRTDRFPLPEASQDWPFYSMLMDRGDRLWIGGGNGLIRVAANPDPAGRWIDATFTRKDGLPGDAVWGLEQTQNGTIWIAASAGLARMEGEKISAVATTVGPVETTAIAKDRDGDLWVATRSRGVLHLLIHGFRAHDAGDGLAGTIEYAFIQPSGTVCLSSSGEGRPKVFCDGGGRFEHLPLATGPSADSATWGLRQAVLAARSGGWYVAGINGISRVDANGRTLQIPFAGTPLQGGAVLRMFEESGGGLWVGVTGTESGTGRWDPATKTWKTWSSRDGLPPLSLASTFAEDRNGCVWIGFWKSDLGRYHDGRFQIFAGDDGLPPYRINALYFDSVGRLWMGFDHAGLAVLEDPDERFELRSYSAADGLASNTILAIAGDPRGRIYVGSPRGLDRLDPDKGGVVSYRTTDGLPASSVRSAVRDRSGRFWFVSGNGEVSSLLPSSEPEVRAPGTQIFSVEIDGVASPVPALGVSTVDGLVLPPGHRQVRIEFGAILLHGVDQVRFQFGLGSGEPEWSRPGSERSAVYGRMAPGIYRFSARAISGDGPPGSVATVNFRVEPPIWRRWWFILLAALAGSAMLYGLYRVRVERLLAVERIRTRIATDLHDDIASSLSQVMLLSELAGRKSGDTEVRESFDKIAGVSREVLDSMSDIVWAINPRRDRSSDLVHRMRRFANDVLCSRDIAVTFQVPLAGKDAKLGPDVRRQVYLVLKESVNNVARHSGATEAWIEMTIDKGWLELKVRDNGHGLEVSDTVGGHGLDSMKRRAASLGGTLAIESAPGHGVTILLRAPVEPARSHLFRWVRRGVPPG